MRRRALVVGVGGLGCPAAMALARAGVDAIGLCDDDAVERSNLHRQILFGDGDVGEPKIDAAARALARLAPGTAIERHATRLLPDNALDLVRRYDVVLEGSDNFATKFLASDACALARVPVIHAASVRWIGTVLAVAAGARPCYRCLYEDVPAGDAPNCAEAGVMGPVVGVVAAVQVDLALSLLDGASVGGMFVTFDGRSDALRRHTISARPDCPLCGNPRRIRGIESTSYVSPACTG